MNHRLILARHQLIARPLRGLSSVPHTAGELRRMRRLHQANHLYRRLEPYLCAVAFAGLVLVAAKVVPVLWGAVGGLL